MLQHSDRRLTARWAKSGPPHAVGVFTLSACLGRQPKGGRVRKPAGFVAALARGPMGPRCAPLLSSGLPDAIRVGPNGRKVL
jgi:hypothetical protein